MSAQMTVAANAQKQLKLDITTNKNIIVGPEYKNITYKDNNGVHTRKVETITNKSVQAAFELAVNKGKELVTAQESTVKDLVYNLLGTITNEFKLSKIPKAQTIFMHTLNSSKSMMRYFINYVHNQYVKIIEDEHNAFNGICLNYINELLGFTFDREVFTTNNNPEFMEPSTWFSTEFALYNPAVNFEHVCMITDLMLDDLINIDENLLYAFYYFLYKYNENIKQTEKPQVMKFIIYHCMKIIRVHYIGNLEQHEKPFDPRDKFINMRFGSKYDKNIEMYGDVRLTQNNKDVLSLFSLTPRSQINYYDDTSIISDQEPQQTSDKFDEITNFSIQNKIFFNWNKMNGFVESFTNQAIKFTKRYIKKQFDRSLTTEQTFEYLTHIDISYRINFIKTDLYNTYTTCSVNETNRRYKEIIKLLLIQNMQKMLEEKQVYENKFTDIYMNYFVYITYTSKIEDTVTVRTIPTGFRLKTLLSCDVSSSDIDENIIKEINTQVISYIPEVTVEGNAINRDVADDKQTSNTFANRNKQVPKDAMEIRHRVIGKMIEAKERQPHKTQKDFNKIRNLSNRYNKYENHKDKPRTQLSFDI